MIGDHLVTLVPLGAERELVVVAENLAPNPSAEQAVAWTANNGNYWARTFDAAAAHSGAVGAMSTIKPGISNNGVLSMYGLGSDTTAIIPWTGGPEDVLSLGVWVMTPHPGFRAECHITWYDAANVSLGNNGLTWTNLTEGVWTFLKYEDDAPKPGAAGYRTGAAINVLSGAPMATEGMWAGADDAILVMGPTVPAYFDGDTPDTEETSYAWTGTPHDSASTKSEFRGAGGVDITCLVDRVAIRHGRDDADSQPEASSATLDLAPPFETDAMPGLLEIGATVLVETSTMTGGTFPRFRGRITDLSYTWEEAGEHTPNRLLGQVIAVGPLADLGRRVVGDAPWPQELDGARVAAVLEAAGAPLDPLFSDPGTVQILPRDVDSQPALDVATSTAESANGLLWETRDGEVRYADANHRRGIPVGLALDACDVLVTPMWKRSTEALLNKVSLGYGPVPDEGEQARFIADRPDSVAKFGRYELSSETELANADDAAALGNLLLTRNAAPVWVMAELPVDVKGLDPARTDALLGLDMHSLVSLTGLPRAGAAPTSAQLWLEGWTENLAWGEHEITLAVTGYCRTVPAPRWNDVDPGWTWGGMDTEVTEASRNLILNPSIETGAANWSVAQGTRSDGPIPHPVSGADGGIFTSTTGTGSPYIRWGLKTPVTPGETYTASVYVEPTPECADLDWYVSFNMFDADNVASTWSGPYIGPVPAGQMTRLVQSFVIPDGIATTQLTFRPRVVIPIGAVYYWDAAMLELGGGGDYFDGDTPDTETAQYDWAGTPHNSESIYSTVVSVGAPGGLPPDLTWDGISCLGPPQDLGRWDDMPASTRWDLVDPATTWNTYA